MKPGLSVIVPFRRRPELALSVGRALLPAADGIALELVVVELGEADPITMGLVAKHFGASGSCGLQWISAARAFNKSLCLNVGLSESHADLVLLLDADIMITADFLDRGMKSARSGCACFLARVSESEGAGGARPAPGVLLANRDDLVSIGGLNSDLEGWGFEDLDLLIRLRRRGVRLSPFGHAVHLSHGDDKRDIPDGWTKEQSDLRNRAVAWARLEREELDGTLVRDVSAWRSTVDSMIMKRHWGRVW